MQQLIADVRVRQYELTFLLPTSLTSTESGQVEDAISTLAKKYKFTIVSQEDWGKKELAYPIRHAGSRQNQAQFKHWVLEGDVSNAQAFERDLYLQQQLLRHLFVLATKAQEEQAVPKVETE